MLEKLTIYSYKDENLKQQTGKYIVQINPEKYNQQFCTRLDTKPTTDTAGVTTKFVVQEPQDLSLEFYLDSTGAVPAPEDGRPAVTSVPDELNKFKAVVYNYNGEIHSPNYLRVLWGSLQFDCRLVSMDIEYLLFSPSGIPLRAKLAPKFTQYLSPEKIALKAKKSSPDLTHSRTVIAGDSLPLMCYRIYGDSKYYIAIARENGLTDFRNLEPGRQVFFPPLGD